jgi:biopolymer transport protein ExbB
MINKFYALSISALFLSMPVLAVEEVNADDKSVTAVNNIPTEITNLDQLLDSVKSKLAKERTLNKKREQSFLSAKNKQKSLLKRAKRDYELAQKENNPLKKITEVNANDITELKNKLKQETRNLGDVYSTFNEFVGDFSVVLDESMITVQYPERSLRLAQLAANKRLATIEEMEELWLLVQQEMTESGKVTSFEAPIIAADGGFDRATVLRIGTFTAVADGEFLRYIPETQELLALTRQPSSRDVKIAKEFVASKGEITAMVVDPTQGSLLGMISYTPTISERIEQGGVIGSIIIGLGIVGFLLTTWRAFYLIAIHLRIRQQIQNLQSPNTNNPLGRIMLSVGNICLQNEESMQLKLDEAIIAEIPKLERSHNFIKLLAVTSPLLGLLGTVTGMILTFQAISLFGSGDPKLMASGISQALITTVLGLVVAIPVLFGHNLVSSLSAAMVQRLDEQSAGLLARFAEAKDQT